MPQAGPYPTFEPVTPPGGVSRSNVGPEPNAPANPFTARDEFVAVRVERWDELALLCGERVRDTDDTLRLGTLYRETSSDLAFARRAYPNDPLIAHIESTLARARGAVYRRPRRSFSLRRFYTHDYWERIVQRPRLLAAGAVLLLVPAIAAYLWALRDPSRASSMLGDRFTGGRTSWADQGYSATEQAALATRIFTNNIRVSLLAFAAGVTLCFGTAWLLVYNGAVLGVVAGVATTSGHGDVAFTLIVAHGILEMSVILVTAYAGLRMGWAIVDPGSQQRSHALRDEAAAAVEIVLGTIPFFVLAGLVEGFFTPAGFGPVWAGLVGVVLGGAYWVLALVQGRRRTPTAESRQAPAAAALVAAPLRAFR